MKARTHGLALLFVASLSAAPWKAGYIQTTDGVRIHYIEAGAGPSIVFQPGWTMPAEIWEPQITALSQSFRVVAIDPRSQGKSDRPAEGHYAERRAQDIKEVIDQLKLAPTVLVGWSLGVSEVLTYADKFGTSTLRGLVLVDGDTGSDYDAASVRAYGKMLAALQTDRAAFTARFVRSMYKQPHSEAYLKQITAAALGVPTASAVILIGNRIMNGADYRAISARIDKPVLFIGTPEMKSEAGNLKKSLPSARIEIFSGCGHALFVDDPARFNALLAAFAK